MTLQNSELQLIDHQIAVSVSVSYRHYLSISHLSAAGLFANHCALIESSGDMTSLNSLERRQHNAYVVSSVILSAAFLEATINEIFSDCAEQKLFSEDVQNLQARDLMGRLWSRKRGIPRTASYSILDKYEIALELNGKPAMDTGSSPYQDVRLLVDLRNALIHFEPETVSGHSHEEARRLHKFEKGLAGKFALNPLTGAGNPFYPDKLLGAGCANWAVRSAVAFTDNFFTRLGMRPTYEHVRDSYL